MVTVLLSGGLGNQMFQYAAGRALADRLQTTLAVDTYALDKKTESTSRYYDLGVFNLEVKKVSSFRNKLFIKARPFVLNNRRFFRRQGYFTDIRTMKYEPDFEMLKGDVRMSGYFQNEQYFRNAETLIRQDFTFRFPLDGKNLELADHMVCIESVAVHIRRGDYISDKNASGVFAICDKEYYEKAIDYIASKTKEPVFYVFSEDIDWVKENISFGAYPVSYIDWNRGCRSYVDMQLMSLCAHNIIANSSFSWWAAWLNTNSEKIVVAPSQWFRNRKSNDLLDQFYPQGWTKL